MGGRRSTFCQPTETQIQVQGFWLQSGLSQVVAAIWGMIQKMDYVFSVTLSATFQRNKYKTLWGKSITNYSRLIPVCIKSTLH